MIKWLKNYFLVLRQYRKQKKVKSNLYNAKKHALLALYYWKDCTEEADFLFQVKDASLYVRLGKRWYMNESKTN